MEAPEPVDERSPHVVARRDGLILDIQAMDGVRCVLPGDVGGGGRAADLRRGGHGDRGRPGPDRHGEVEARTWYTLSTVMPLTVAEKQYTGEEKQGLLPGLWDKSGKILFKQ